MKNSNNNYCPSHIDVMEGEDKNTHSTQDEAEAGRHAVGDMIGQEPIEEYDGTVNRESGDDIESRPEESYEISVPQKIYWIYHKDLPGRDIRQQDVPVFGEWLLRQSVELVSTLKDLGIEIDGAESSAKTANENSHYNPNLSTVERMEKAEDREAEGVNIAVDLLREIMTVEGVSGVHIMAIGWESIVPTIVERLEV